jgi:hypothetical protein
LQHLIIPETKYTKPLICQPAVPYGIGALSIVLAAIDFHAVIARSDSSEAIQLLMVRRCQKRVHARLSTRYGDVSKDRGLFLENLALRDAVSDETAPQDEVFKVFKQSLIPFRPGLSG